MTISSRKITSFTKPVAALADHPSLGSTALLKQWFDSSPEELRVTLNGLIDDLSLATPGSSGSEYIGSAPITGVTGSTIYAQLVALKALTDSLQSIKADKTDTYTKTELEPYLQGGETSIKYEVYTIVNSNNGNGTFTYKDVNDVSVVGTLTAEGYQTFTLQNGFYDVDLNRVEIVVNDTLQRSKASGGLVELTTTTVALAVPEGVGAEITIKYYERIGLTGEHNLIVGTDLPLITGAKTVWFKVIG